MLLAVIHSVQMKQPVNQKTLQLRVFINFKIFRIFRERIKADYNITGRKPLAFFITVFLSVFKRKNILRRIDFAVVPV